MTREEIIINEVQECIKAYKKRPMYRIDGVDCIVLDNDDINHISHKCAFWILSKEQDLLKEFVEWLKAKYKGKADKQAETYQHFYENGFSMQDCEYHRGKLNEIEDLADELDQNLEQFLEEKVNETDSDN